MGSAMGLGIFSSRFSVVVCNMSKLARESHAQYIHLFSPSTRISTHASILRSSVGALRIHPQKVRETDSVHETHVTSSSALSVSSVNQQQISEQPSELFAHQFHLTSNPIHSISKISCALQTILFIELLCSCLLIVK